MHTHTHTHIKFTHILYQIGIRGWQTGEKACFGVRTAGQERTGKVQSSPLRNNPHFIHINILQHWRSHHRIVVNCFKVLSFPDISVPILVHFPHLPCPTQLSFYPGFPTECIYFSVCLSHYTLCFLRAEPIPCKPTYIHPNCLLCPRFTVHFLTV